MWLILLGWLEIGVMFLVKCMFMCCVKFGVRLGGMDCGVVFLVE